MTETPTEEHAQPEAVPERQTTPFLVLQFFIFPMAIVAVCVTVFVIFGLISTERKSPRAYLAEVRTGGGLFNIKRWQAAFALANALESEKDLARIDPQFVDDVVGLFEESEGDDPLVRRYLALALGRLADARAVPCLRKALGNAGTADSQTLIYAIWALGAIGDPSALPDLLPLAGSEDAGIRKAAVHALGAFRTEESQAALLKGLNDATEDVRWNAAVALARQRDRRGAPVLLQMLDRAHQAGVEGLTPEQAHEAMLQAVAAAALIPDPALRSALERLRDRDDSVKVREAARRALEGQQR